MYKVQWADAQGAPHEVTGTEAECRSEFKAQCQRASAGEIEFILLVSPDGIFLDTWGT